MTIKTILRGVFNFIGDVSPRSTSFDLRVPDVPDGTILSSTDDSSNLTVGSFFPDGEDPDDALVIARTIEGRKCLGFSVARLYPWYYHVGLPPHLMRRPVGLRGEVEAVVYLPIGTPGQSTGINIRLCDAVSLNVSDLNYNIRGDNTNPVSPYLRCMSNTPTYFDLYGSASLAPMTAVDGWHHFKLSWGYDMEARRLLLEGCVWVEPETESDVESTLLAVDVHQARFTNPELSMTFGAYYVGGGTAFSSFERVFGWYDKPDKSAGNW